MIETLLASELLPLAIRAVGGATDRARAQRRRTMLIEDLLLELLDREAKQQGVAGRTANVGSGRLQFDAIYPEGLSDLPGPLAVEIKLWGSPRAAQALGAALDSKIEAARTSDVASLLVLHDVAMVPERQARLLSNVERTAGDVRIVLWGPEEIDALLDRYRDELSTLLRDAALEPLRAALEGETDWRAESAERLGQLRGVYQGEGVVLLLGAGVSIGSGLPGWDELVSALFVSLVTKQLSVAVDEDQALHVSKAAQRLGSDSPLLSARYLRRGIEEGNAGDSGAFQQALSNALYRSVDRELTASPLLRELAKLRVPLRTGPKVHSVITYNFDDLFEAALDSEAIAHRSVFSGREHPSETELAVFHAHGFLPRDVEKFEGLDEGILAFSEEGYHQLFRDPCHWTNVMQLQAFQQRTCVFIGLSITDPNLRRLLEYSALRDDEPRHFVFLKRSTAEDLMGASPLDADEKPLLNPDSATAYLRVHHSLQERVLRELGLKIVWFENYDDMPPAVSKLRQ